jgi:hypothetical protein
MADFELSVLIRAHPDVAFEFLADSRNLPMYVEKITEQEWAGVETAPARHAAGGDEKIEGEAHFEIDPTRRELEWSSDASTGYRGRLVVTPEDEGARVEVLLSAEGSDDGMVDGISSALEGAKALIEAGHRSATEDERRWPEG